MIIEAHLNQTLTRTLTAVVTAEVPDDFPEWTDDEKADALGMLYVEATLSCDFEHDPGDEDEVEEDTHSCVTEREASVTVGTYPHFRIAKKGDAPIDRTGDPVTIFEIHGPDGDLVLYVQAGASVTDVTVTQGQECCTIALDVDQLSALHTAIGQRVAALRTRE